LQIGKGDRYCRSLDYMHDTTTCEDSNLVSVFGALDGVTIKALDLVFGDYLQERAVMQVVSVSHYNVSVILH